MPPILIKEYVTGSRSIEDGKFFLAGSPGEYSIFDDPLPFTREVATGKLDLLQKSSLGYYGV
jgi:hypothetical protein